MSVLEIKSEISDKEKLEDIAHELALILTNVKEPSQINRIQRDLDKLSEIYQDLTGEDLSDFIVRNNIALEENSGERMVRRKYITKIHIDKVSPHCEEQEINLIYSIINEFEIKYWTVLSERHTRLDYSHASVRDTFYSKLVSLKRSINLYGEQVEEMHQSQSREYKSRLRQTNNKQHRIILMEYKEFFRELRGFLQTLVDDLAQDGTIVTNANEEIIYDKLDGEPYFAGKRIGEIVRMIYEFVSEAEYAVNVPDF